ncbi:MAG: class I SAM-dependent methyltransferase [Aquificaceae bacterium]|nr:class I SAM-dependent methyltransferase [Aquificaceae bacterium]MDW8236882.1 class I SAM-dependent methyltransferase [Aquificaceae bacterium]
MNNELNERVFSSISGIYDLFLSLATLGQISRWQEELLKCAEAYKNHLDIGTGTGEVLIKSKGGLKVGLDISLEMLKRAKRKESSGNFILADALKLPFKDGSFNLITLSLTYRHLPKREEFLKEAKRVLDVSGKLCLLDIARPPRVLVVLIKALGFLPGVLIFGIEKWRFLISSIEHSQSLDEVLKELKSAGFEPTLVKTKLFSLIFIACSRRSL